MEHWFEVQHLDIDRLLAEWRRLCPGQMRLVARNVFGDLFLAEELGKIIRLDVAVGKLETVADSENQFREFAQNSEKRTAWFAVTDEKGFAARGLIPNETQCIGFDIPLVFAESDRAKPYVIDIYEHVSFLGDLNRQIADAPDGEKVKLNFKSSPS